MAGNTTSIHGKICRFVKNSVAMDFTEGWEVTFTLDLANTDRQGQSWGENVPGHIHGQGRVNGQCVMANTEQKAIFDNIVTATPGTKLTDCKCQMEDSGDYLSGNLYVNTLALSARNGDKFTFSFGFVTDGAWSITVA